MFKDVALSILRFYSFAFTKVADYFYAFLSTFRKLTLKPYWHGDQTLLI